MTPIVEVGLSNAAAAVVLAIVALAVSLCCRRPAVVHAMWLLVLIKLVTPPLVHIPVPMPASPAADGFADRSLPARVEPSPCVPEQTDEDPDEPDVIVLPPIREERIVGDFEVANKEAVQIADTPPVFPWIRVVGWTWLGGSVLWFALAGLRLWRFGRLLRLGRPAPRALLARMRRLADRVGLASPPEVRMLSGRLAPMIWGTGRPLLLLPEGLEEQVGEDGLDTLLLHELSHLRRGDHLVRWLEFVALGLFWWLPVTWFARRELREAEEQCCDAWVVRTMPGAEKLYATALVEALDFLSQPTTAIPPLASALGQVADLKRRLTMIMRGTTPHLLGRPAGLAVFGLACFLLPLVPSLGLGQSGPREERKEVIRFADGDQRGLEIELKRKMEEIEVLKKKIQEVARAKAEGAKKHVEVLRGKIIHGQEHKAHGGAVIRIEISGGAMKKEELKELVEKLEKMLPGKDRKVTIHVDGSGDHGKPGQGKGIITIDRDRKRFEQEHGRAILAPKRPAAPTPPTPPGFPKGPPGAPAPRGDDRRIDSLEKRLDAIMRELESLRKEMRGPAGRGGPGGRGFGEGSGRPGGPGEGGGRGFGGGSGRPGGPGNPGEAGGSGRGSGGAGGGGSSGGRSEAAPRGEGPKGPSR